MAQLMRDVTLALTRNGDLHIIDNGRYSATRRRGKWIVLNHAENTAQIETVATRSDSDRAIVRTLYGAALDLSSKHSGGLLVWLTHDNLDKARQSLVPTEDQVGYQYRAPGEAALDDYIHRRRVGHTLPRAVLVDLASLDGAVVVAPDGEILGYGSVLNHGRSSKNPSQGARTKAALAASQYGMVIKVSSDGDISGYYKGQPIFSI